MALAALSGDGQLVIFSRLCNVLDPGVAVAFGSASSELWTLTQAPRQQLQADYEAAAALGRKAEMRSCKQLREAERRKAGVENASAGLVPKERERLSRPAALALREKANQFPKRWALNSLRCFGLNPRGSFISRNAGPSTPCGPISRKRRALNSLDASTHAGKRMSNSTAKLRKAREDAHAALFTLEDLYPTAREEGMALLASSLQETCRTREAASFPRRASRVDGACALTRVEFFPSASVADAALLDADEGRAPTTGTRRPSTTPWSTSARTSTRWRGS